MRKEITALREQMNKLNIDYYIVTTTDAHNSEYVSDKDMVLRFITGFSGSNGTLLVSKSEALLWTDGRYYIQCEKELSGSGIVMMREGDARDDSIEQFLAKSVKDGERIGFNGDNITAHRAKIWFRDINDRKYELITDVDLAGHIWDENGDRPDAPYGRIRNQDLKYAGEELSSKLKRVNDKVIKRNCTHLFTSRPDDIMWLFNLRGEDVAYNPVALSYAFISVGTACEAHLFLNGEGLDNDARCKLDKNNVIIHAYEDIFGFLKSYDYKGNVMVDEREISVNAKESICTGLNTKYSVISCVSPITELKAVKNDAEIANMKKYFLIDSLAMTQYIFTVKKIMGCAIPAEAEAFVLDEYVAKYANKSNCDFIFDEIQTTKLCDEIRCGMPDCEGLSFATIAAYGANAAMMHYEASEESYAECKSCGMLLTDCGGQYPGATTDVTRTIALGEVSDEQKRDYTLVLKGWLALMHATWLYGCTGRNLDILARQYLWNEGIDYKCGTGHGVGYNLSVHEGPQNVRWRYIEGSSEAILKSGMVITNEPGVYKSGRYGIRTENTMLVIEKFVSDNEQYLGFENLTWVPIDTDLVDYSLLDDKEKAWLEEYQAEVYSRLSEQRRIHG
ncbi:MAG: aminopeptidase P family N-terminal domain-containing protein [Lachnospiraceae bacterium]|nr:aminopeptidase P family N-terminal domain-containing protein [Lachnospiraceae bacterium]